MLADLENGLFLFFIEMFPTSTQETLYTEFCISGSFEIFFRGSVDPGGTSHLLPELSSAWAPGPCPPPGPGLPPGSVISAVLPA